MSYRPNISHDKSLDSIVTNVGLVFMASTLTTNTMERSPLKSYSRSGRQEFFPLPINPYPTAFPYGNVMVLHFYQQQESSTTKTLHKVINKRLKAYV